MRSLAITLTLTLTLTLALAWPAQPRVQQGDRGTASPASASPVYAVEPLTFSLKSGERVGSKRSGSFCLPAGGLIWREVKPGADEAVAAVVGRLRVSGLIVRKPGDAVDSGAASPAGLITGEVVALKLNACVPPGGLGRLLNRSTTVKGGGSINVRWSVKNLASPGSEWTWQSCPTFTYHEKDGALSDMVLAGVAQAADDVAKYITSEQGGLAFQSGQSSTSNVCIPGQEHPSVEPG